MMESNLKRLEQNLLNQNNLLDRVHELCDRQIALLDNPEMDAEEFDACMDEQDGLLQEFDELNEEMDRLYESLKSEQLSLDGPYAVQVKSMRTLVSAIMQSFNSLQQKEQLKKQKLEAYFDCERKNFASGRKTSKAALDYFKNMNRSNVIPPQFMDQKK